MHYMCVWHTNSIYLSKFLVNTVTHIEVIRQNVCHHTRVMVIGVGNDLKSPSHFGLSLFQGGGFKFC